MNHLPFENELIKMANKDLSVLEKLLKAGALSEGYHPEMESIHKDNAQRLREIILEIGYPTILKVGTEASNAAWLIIQHAIGEPEFMKECLIMMEENSNDINPMNKAYLYDRVQVFRSKPQKYGTQLTADGAIYPVEDTKKLNEERRKVNLPTLSKEEINKIPGSEEIPEIDSKDPEYMAWRKKTGWI